MRYSIRIGQDGKSRSICCGNKRYQDDVRKSNIREVVYSSVGIIYSSIGVFCFHINSVGILYYDIKEAFHRD